MTCLRYSLLVITLGAIACLSNSCTEEPRTEDGAACCEELPTEQLSAGSVYQLGSTWTDPSKTRINLGELLGEVRIAAFIFTRCEFACPRILADLQSIEEELAKRNLRARFLLITMDHEHDTPEVLDAYRRQHHLDPERWTLLHGNPDDILDLAALLGVKFKKAGGTYSHSNVITVLDRTGTITYQQKGLGSDTTPTLTAIEQALRP